MVSIPLTGAIALGVDFLLRSPGLISVGLDYQAAPVALNDL